MIRLLTGVRGVGKLMSVLHLYISHLLEIPAPCYLECNVMVANQATLLLPSSPASSLPITSQTIKDHIIFTSTSTPTNPTGSHSSPAGAAGAAGASGMFVTMSGLIGNVDGLVCNVEAGVR